MARINIARLTKSKWLILIFYTFFYGFTACSNDKSKNIWPPVPPIEIPLDVQKMGHKIEIDFQIIEQELYAFNLDFLFKEGDKNDRDRARKFSGGHVVACDKPKKGCVRPEEKGIPLSLILIIHKVNDNKNILVFKEEINTDEIGIYTASITSLDKEIARLNLVPGRYHASVETSFVSSELGRTPINFSIHFAHRGK